MAHRTVNNGAPKVTKSIFLFSKTLHVVYRTVFSSPNYPHVTDWRPFVAALNSKFPVSVFSFVAVCWFQSRLPLERIFRLGLRKMTESLVGTSNSAPSRYSEETVSSIVDSLMFHRQGGESESFIKLSIRSLVKKLKDRMEALNSLFVAVTSSGRDISPWVTIPRTLGGRIEVILFFAEISRKSCV